MKTNVSVIIIRLADCIHSILKEAKLKKGINVSKNIRVSKHLLHVFVIYQLTFGIQSIAFIIPL